MAQLGARLDGIEEVVGSNPIGSTKSIQSNLLTDHHFWHGTVKYRLNALYRVQVVGSQHVPVNL